jgi:hypothetical protein
MDLPRSIVWLARGGYAARGVVYLIVAFFAALAAVRGSETVDTRGAVLSLLDEPQGRAMLWAVALGLFAHAAWRFVQALRDTDHHGRDAKGLAIRAGLVGSGMANGLIALFALGLVSSVGGGGSGSDFGGGRGDLLTGLLGWDRSNLMVYAIALVPLSVGIAHLVKAWKAKFMRYFEAEGRVNPLVRPVSRFGLAARGVVFLMIAALLFVGGSRIEPRDPPGLKDALDALRGLPFGTLLLGVMGVGLLAFALYSFAQARWRRIDVDAALRG